MEKSCSLLVHFDKGTPALANEIKEALEGNDVEAKIDAMKNAIMLLLNGATLPQLFITIVRYVLPSEDHTVQKLLLLYLEIIDKTDGKGRVLPEMILICQNLRNNLQHPNEYIRGATLRFLCRLNEVEIIEPLIPSIMSNLEHRHPYVRRNAILAVMSIYKLPQGEHLLVDAPETVEKFLSTEQDPSAKRNAFLMLFNCAQDRAISYLLTNVDRGTPALANEIKEALEGNDVEAKIDAMKNAIMLLLNGETLPQLFITIVRYVLPSEDHTVQKLLLLYLEIIDKTDGKGRVLPEMILICQNLRNNLQHPNEYIRGVTLRFLCRLNEVEIIEPLIPSIMSNLEHRHPYVRRNAILAVMSIYKLPQGEHLLVDAPETVEKFLSTEQDPSAKRNAFLMLFNCAQERAISYLLTNVDRVSDWGELLQMVVLELIRKVCRTNKDEKGKYIKIIISLLNAPSAAVVYECAGTLVSLSSAPTAIRAAANTYCQLLLSQSDNNVKLIVLDRLNEIKSSHRDIMVDMIMDVLRVLSSPNLDIRRKTLDIVLELITTRNVNEVVLTLKKEVMKTQSGELEKNGEYRQMLIQAIHSCAIKFPEVASTVVHLLMDFLGDNNVASALDVIVFVREIIETNPKLRVSVITRLLDTFYQIRAARVCSCALWIIGEYSLSLSEVESAIATIKQCLGELPFFSVSEEEESADSSKKSQQPTSITVSSRRPAILADGTYATQSAASETSFTAPAVVQGSLASGNLRSLLLTGDFFLGAVIACTLAKLNLRLEEVQLSKIEVNKATSNALLIMVSMLQLGQSSVLPHPIDNDSYDRIVLCIRLLCNTGDAVRKIWLKSCRESFVKMLSDKQLRETEEIKAKAQISHSQPDDLIDFYHLKSRK
ncbi:Coatomer subunit beta-1, partial [Striga hermonthica]